MPQPDKHGGCDQEENHDEHEEEKTFPGQPFEKALCEYRTGLITTNVCLLGYFLER